MAGHGWPRGAGQAWMDSSAWCGYEAGQAWVARRPRRGEEGSDRAGMVRSGVVLHGLVWQAWHGEASFGWAWQGRHGVMWHGAALAWQARREAAW